METIGKKIAALRTQANMSEKDLAEKLLVGEETVRAWESDELSPDLHFIPVLADIFGVSCDELIRIKREHAPILSHFNVDMGASNENEKIKGIKKKTLLFFGIPCLCVFVILTIACVVFGVLSPYKLAKEKAFYDYNSFQQYMEREAYGNDFDIDEPPAVEEKKYYILDENGEELSAFYWRNRTVKRYVVSNGKGGLVIKTYDERALQAAKNSKGVWIGVLIAAAVIDVGTFVCVYVIKTKRAEKQ